MRTEYLHSTGTAVVIPRTLSADLLVFYYLFYILKAMASVFLSHIICFISTAKVTRNVFKTDFQWLSNIDTI